MKYKIPAVTIGDYFEGVQTVGDTAIQVDNVSSLDSCDRSCLVFYSGKNFNELEKIDSGCIIASSFEFGTIEKLDGKVIVLVPNPKFTFLSLLRDFFDDQFTDKQDISPGGKVSSSAYIEKGANIGANSIVSPHSCIYRNSKVGQDCIIGSGAVLGAPGLGDLFHDGKYHRFVHLGSLIVEDNVTIGTNVSVARGMLEDTIIGEGTRIANNVNIGHGTMIGKNCYISSGVTVGGACIIEDNCWLAPGVSTRDHIKIGANTMIGTGAVLIKDALSDSLYLGNPARKVSERK